MGALSNISIAEFRVVLTLLGLTCVRTKGGHESWLKEGMIRPVVFQSHVNPVPEFIIRTNLHTLGISRDQFLQLLRDL